MGLSFGVLGPLQIRGEGDVEVQRPSHRRLLSILLLAEGRRLTADALIERFWGGAPPAGAKAALQTHISALRRLLPEDVIVTEGFGYRLDLEGHELDATVFAARADDVRALVRSHDWHAAAAAADQALELWRGTPFTELPDDDFAIPLRSHLQELHLTIQELRAEALLGGGRAADILPTLEGLVLEQPLRERLWEHLMVARYRLGRHADALRAYHDARATLAEIGLDAGPGLRRLEAQILRHDEGLGRTAQTNLPVELTTFVGRHRELSAVAELLTQHRLVTLTGVGGAGKTRLAYRAAAGALDGFPDGCWAVELAAIRDPDRVAPAIAASLGVRPAGEQDVLEQLEVDVADKALLLVLDNCEHLLPIVTPITRALLEAGAHVRVLATSRAPLAVPGEAVFEVPPLSHPEHHGPTPDVDRLRSYDAVRLFEDRVRLVRPGYEVTVHEAGAVASLCRRLDGLPLALELAAARMRSLAAATILERLDDRFHLLTGGGPTVPARHRTLAATVRWSYSLLAPAEQAVFARLSVFRGGFDVEMAESICAVEAAAGVGHEDPVRPHDVLAHLLSLVDKSLVTTHEAAGARRFRLLETLRDFAGDRLEERGEAAASRDRHCGWFVGLARRLKPWFPGPDRTGQFERLAREADNLAAALAWAQAQGRAEDLVALAGAIAGHLADQGHERAALAHLRLALGVCDEVADEADLRSRLAAAWFSLGNVDAAFEEARRAVELAAEAPPRGRAAALTRYARLHLLLVDRDPGDAVPLARQAVEIAAALHDPFVEIHSRSLLAASLGWSGSIDEALEQQRTALDLAIAAQDESAIGEMYGAFFDLLYLHPVARRDEPGRIVDELIDRIPETGEDWTTHRLVRSDWVAYVWLQRGDWEGTGSLIEKMAAGHREGYARTWQLMLLATLRWMQGRLDAAAHALDDLRRMGVNPRWYHDYYPLLADIAADDGRLQDVRTAAAEYLAVDVHDAEVANKVAVLSPVVRAEVEAALASEGADRKDHRARAESALARMHELLVAWPPPTGGSLQIETHRTHVAFAEAELSRLTGPDPGLWQVAAERADYLHFRLYARWRLAEALLAGGAPAQAAAEITAAHAEAARAGADRIRRGLEALAEPAGIDPEVAFSAR